MGPLMIIFAGVSLITLPEAAKLTAPLATASASVLRGRQRRAHLASGWCGERCCWWHCPGDSGSLMLGQLWRPTYPLVLPATLSMMAGCAH